MHTALTARFRVQRAFKHRTEYRRAYLAPVKALACARKQQSEYFIIKRRYLYVLIRKQPAVYIRKRRQIGIVIRKIWIALVRFAVEHAKQIDQRAPTGLYSPLAHIIVEHIGLAKYARVLGVHAEHQPHAQHIKAFLSVFAFRFFVLFKECIVQTAYQFARLYGDFHLTLYILIASIDEEVQARVFLFQIGQF